MPNNLIDIEVVYAESTTYKVIALQVVDPTTIEQAIVQSGILALFPQIDLYAKDPNSCNCVGIFNELKQLNDVVSEGARVEIYRPLVSAPMQARKVRAKEQKSKQSKKVTRRE